jgi:ketosteroid isomerase-like protein
MSRENVEIVRTVYEEWGKGNFRAGVDLYDSRILLVQGAGFPESGAYHGREGIREYMRTFLEAWTGLTIEADDFLEAGDTVVAEVVQRGAGKGSGAAPAELRYFHLWSFRGPKVIRLEIVRNRNEALEAAGLSE